MNIYGKKKKLVISVILFIFCFLSADLSLAAETKKDIATSRSYFYYTIKKGDTLWDLSRKFYNSNWVWPGLWEINGRIKNPHLIYPGKKIKIFLRENIKEQKPAIPVKEIKTMVEHEIHPTFYYPDMDGLGFIRKKSITPLGRIIKSVKNGIMISQGDIIYIEPLGDETMIPGTKYKIFTTKKITRRYKNEKFKGVKHSIKGIVEILANKEGYLTAKIIKSFRYASKGDLIMGYRKQNCEIKIRNALKNIDARLICSENNNYLISSYTTAFINMGSDDDIKPGQIYGIFKKQEDRESPVSKEKFIFAPLRIGRLIVLYTEKSTSTVMILSSQNAIKPGDIVR